MTPSKPTRSRSSWLAAGAIAVAIILVASFARHRVEPVPFHPSPAPPASLISQPTKAPAGEEQAAEAGSSVAEREEWKRYLKGDIHFNALSPGNQLRAHRRAETLAGKSDAERREQLREATGHLEAIATTGAAEAELRKRSEQLYWGMTQPEVLKLMGKPSRVGFTLQRLIREQEAKQSKGLPTERLTIPKEFDLGPEQGVLLTQWLAPEALNGLPLKGPGISETLFLYSPDSDGSDRRGVLSSFQCLRLWFNPNSTLLAKWAWETPMISR